MTRPAREWIVFAAPNLGKCLRCGASEVCPLPMTIPAFAKWADYFTERHKHCKSVTAGEER